MDICSKRGLVDTPGCGRCKEAIETPSDVLCNCETIATLRFRHLGQHCIKPGDFEGISVSRILHFVQDASLLNVKGLHKWLITSAWVTCPPLCILSCTEWVVCGFCIYYDRWMQKNWLLWIRKLCSVLPPMIGKYFNHIYWYMETCNDFRNFILEIRSLPVPDCC
jgi:hypothetical protein